MKGYVIIPAHWASVEGHGSRDEKETSLQLLQDNNMLSLEIKSFNPLNK